MSLLCIVVLCAQALFLDSAFGSVLPCPNNVPANVASMFSDLNLADAPFKITSAKFTPISEATACQAGLPGPMLSEMEANLQFGDVTVSGDLPIGGTIKVCGCFPVYGMVAVDGVVPSTGSAVASAGCQFPAKLQAAGPGCV